MLDSIWRRAEFNSSRTGTYVPLGVGTFQTRTLLATPVGVQLALVILFFCYGPTFESLCTAFNLRTVEWLRKGLGGAALLIAALLAWALIKGSWQRIKERKADYLEAIGAAASTPPVRARFLVARIVLLLVAVLSIVPLGFLAAYEFTGWTDPHACDVTPFATAARLQILVLLLGLAVGAWILLRKQWTALRQLCFILLTLALLATALWGVILPFLGTPASAAGLPFVEKVEAATEARGTPYLHVFAVFILALLLLALFARVLAHWCVDTVTPDLRKIFQDRLQKTEVLRDPRPDPRLTHVRLISALVNGVLYHPLHLLLLPAMAALFSSTDWMWFFTLMFLGVAALFIMWGSLSSRWEQFIQLIDRWFLAGTPLVVSLAAIVIAALRLADFSYVSTVLDAAPFGTLFIFLVIAYSTLWLMEYWINRWLGERLLAVLGAPNPSSGFFMYGPPLQQTGGPHLRGQVLALHGTGRFAVHGWYWRSYPAPRRAERLLAFTTFGFIELFDRLGRDEEPDCANNIRRRVRLYFNLVNILLVLMLVGFMSLRQSWNKPLAQKNVVEAVRDGAPDKPFDLATAILNKSREEGGRPSIIVAASGGGTRAALYTATALEGLARLGRSRDIVLLSGVSGGGLAAAYFASRFDQFERDAYTDAQAWSDYKAAMAEPFIQDVLEGASEWRIQSTTPLGTLLAESFDRRLFTAPGSARTLGDLTGVGLILNSTVSGHPRKDSVMLDKRMGSLSSDRCYEQSRPFSSLAGGRLIFTNLDNVKFPPEPNRALADVRFDYAIVRDGGVPLAAASALNANFPPVFPNARVRLKPAQALEADGLPPCPVSYFVTDGGATENLGLLSALYALRAALPDIKAGLRPNEKFPDIHIVAIEASALSYDYSNDRGIGAATGGSKERIAGGLTQEIMQDILREIGTVGPEAKDSIHIDYLSLPVAFRSRGGFGTHWMSARTVRVSNPLTPDPRGKLEHEALDECQVMSVWSALYDPDRFFCARPDTDDSRTNRVKHWICGRDPQFPNLDPDWQIGAWQKVVDELREGPSPSAPRPLPKEPSCKE